MNWSDERYVRLYVRDTVTWKRWTWEARAVFGLLLRRVDRAGILDAGGGDKAEALALMLEVPLDVAARVLPQWVASGTVTDNGRSLVLSSFIEAQEATQSDRLRQSESRAKRRAAAMTEQAVETTTAPVTSGHAASQDVTPAVPCCTVPSRADTATTAKRSKPKPIETPEVLALRQAWNELTKSPIPKWTAGRVKAALAALERRPLEQWREVFRLTQADPWLRGDDGKWCADIDYVLRPEGSKPEPALKILERGARLKEAGAPQQQTRTVLRHL